MSNFKRMTVLAGACAIAVPLSVAGVGPAGAETVGPGTGSGTGADVQRWVSGDAIVGGKVHQGDRITVVVEVNRKFPFLISSITDVHDSCMAAVPESSVWTVSGESYTNDPTQDFTQKPEEVTIGDGTVRIKAGISWQATPLTWAQDYIVNCAPGELMTGGLRWVPVSASEQEALDLGPTITVVSRSTGGGDDNGSSGTGSLDTGSLGSLFG